MIGSLDLALSAGYLLAIFGIGLWAGLSRKQTSAGSYFLAGKTLRWPTIGLALFATNISCLHLVSLAQSGFDSGLLSGNFEWMAVFVLILLALFFVPFYIRTGVTTLPDFLERRYDRACRDWLAGISVLSAIIVHIAFSLLAGGIVLQTLFGVGMYTSVVVISVLTGIYTIVGGLRAVVVTESIQTVVLLAGALVISAAAWQAMGGWEPMEAVLRQEGSLDRLSMLRPAGDEMPWYAVFLGYPVLGIWYWCADQTIVQRVLGAKNEREARLGPIFCGFIKILPVFVFVMPGLFAYTLWKTGGLDLRQLIRPETGTVDSKGIYTLMITQLLPEGLIGIVIAALLSGLMSQISGALNSISTLVSYDLYARFRPGRTDRELVRVGRISAGISLLVSLALLPLLNQYESLFNGINDIIAHLAPPITCVFLTGIFWGKATALSARYTLWIGSAAGVFVYAGGKLAGIGAGIPFLLMAFYLFVFCLLLQVVLTWLAPAPASSLSWKSPGEALKNADGTGGGYRLAAVVLLIVMTGLFWLFR